MDRDMRQFVDGMQTRRGSCAGRSSGHASRAQRPDAVVICCSDSAPPPSTSRAPIPAPCSSSAPSPAWYRPRPARSSAAGCGSTARSPAGSGCATCRALLSAHGRRSNSAGSARGAEHHRPRPFGLRRCGARHATAPRPADLPDTDGLVDMVRPTVRRAIAMMDRTSAEARLAAERAVVLWSRRNLLRHAGIERRVRQGKSNVYAGHYDIASGQVTFWNEATSRFEPVVTVAAAGAEGGPETACCSPPCSRRRKTCCSAP